MAIITNLYRRWPCLRSGTSRWYSSRSHKSFQGEIPAGSTIFSLIQPTGKIHLGNYLGAIRNWRDMSQHGQKGVECIFGIADLHAITVPYQAPELRQNRYEAIASLVASGIDPEKCILYMQSSVSEHTELFWILTSLTSMGSLNRMTQWKLKSQQTNDSSIFDDSVLGNTKAGLLCYPVLQAADVLLYKSTHVPVGDDQSQHLELCRSIAGTFNSTFNTNYFPLPQTVLTPAKKILSLRDPSKKMSKSDADQNSSVYIHESPDIIAKKIRKATTDSIQGPLYFDPVERPGVSNLLNIVSGLTRTSIEQTVKELSWIANHKQLKDYVTELIVEEFKPTRKLFDDLMANPDYLSHICKQGQSKTKAIASANLNQIKDIAGLD